MNALHTTRLLIAAGFTVTAALAPTAFAQTRAVNTAGEAYPVATPTPEMSMSTTNRAEVQAEAQRAIRSGELTAGRYHEGKPYVVVAQPTKTRAERKAETLQAARDNKLMPAGEAIETH